MRNGTIRGDSGGIFTAGSNSRIEANNCTDNDYGIRVSGTTNVIARNTCSFNVSGNWDVVAGNCINVYNAQSSLEAITTNAGGIPFAGRDDPNANYTYGVN
jgi:parallel beta-helix repeat protein